MKVLESNFKWGISCLLALVLLASCGSNDDNNDSNNSNNGQNDENTIINDAIGNCFTNIKIPEFALGTYKAPPTIVVMSETATIIELDSGLYTINFDDNIPPFTNLQFCGIEREISDGIKGFLFGLENDEKQISITLAINSEDSELTIIKLSEPQFSFGGNK